jgi:hypothetical protein
MDPSKDASKPEPTQPKAEQPKAEQPRSGKAAAARLEPPLIDTGAAGPAGEPSDADQPVLQSPTTKNAIKLAGEAILPGASLLMDGQILHGGLHLLAGAVAKAFLGPVGIAVVIANSYSNSTTGKNLLAQFQRLMPSKTDPKPE